MKHLYLVDGSGFIFRAFHAVRPLTRSDGTPVNAVYGFSQMLMKLVDDSDADHIAIIFDAARKTFRNDIYPDYKAHRPPPPDELIPQFSLVKAAAEAFGLPAIEMPGYEADDIIATYARLGAEAGAKVTIVSSDKDLMQLVNENVTMLDTMKNRRIGKEEVYERFGVGPEKVVEVQALAGDSVDNVPGVPGIGVKTAALLINEFGDLETLLERAGEIKQNKRRENLLEFADLARISRSLVQLKQDVPVKFGLSEFVRKEMDIGRAVAFLTEQGFKSIVTRLAPEAAGTVSTDDTPPKDVSYELVVDEQSLQPWIDQAIAKGFVAVDTETTSLDAMAADLVGISLSVEPGRACYIPVAHKGTGAQGSLDLGEAENEIAEAPKQISRKKVLNLLQPLLEDTSVLKIGQNIKYDALVFLRNGVTLRPVDDTMLCSFVLEGGAGKHSMDALAERHLGLQTTKYKDVVGTGKKQITFDYVPLEKACDYAAEDADITLRLHRQFKRQLVEEKMVAVYETIERPLISVLIGMEKAGIRVDQAMLKRLSRDFAQRLGGLEDEIKTLAGEDFNVGSPKQLGEILFDKLGLPGAKKTKTGAYQTDARVLEDLAAGGHDLATRVLDWRQLSKLKSTYTDSLVEDVNLETGRIHTSYSMAGAQTGRLSSTDPNLQNIPIRTEEGRKIRQAFVPKEGCKLISLDYSQIELRVVAHMAGIDALIQAFHDGADIHAITASQVFDVPIERMEPMVRRKAKAINFGIIYGISAFGLARQLGIEQKEAKVYIEAYFERYPGIKDYMERLKAECRKSGMVETLFGRRIHLPGINDKNHMTRNYAERQAINAPVQGTAADIIKRAMIRVPQALQKKKLKAEMLLQVHDELLFEAPVLEVDGVIEIISQVMENAVGPAVSLSVPLDVEVGVGDNWDEAH
ncbi:MAG: DNA polymerase I [Rhodospirillaceae bacterium]|nr:DNA polymerase I [Rhodospirillaceae bacterium]